jgi:hypothetical protein
VATKAKPKFNRDDPRLWKAWDDWSAAKLYAASKGYFNIREDGKVGVAFGKNDIAFLEKMTKKRLKAVGATKPKFKKAKKLGQAGMDEPGTMANALRIYERKLFGTPKPMPKTKKAKPKGLAKKAVNKKKPPHKNPVGPPNPGLPQNDAYTKARKKLRENEILLYITHRGENRYTATYYNEKTKKRRSAHVTGEYVPNYVPAAEPKKPKVKKAVKKSEPKKPKKKQSHY